MKNLILISIVLLYGCSAEKRLAKKQKYLAEICATCPVKETKIDSTWYKEYVTYRDSVINAPKDSASIEYVVSPCPDGSIPPIRERYKRDGRKTSLSGTVKDGVIKVDATVGMEQLKFQYKELIKENNRLKETTKVLPCIDKWGEDFFYYSGIVAYIISALTLAIALIWWSINKRNKNNNGKNI